jgi:hypothetical protein
VYPDKEIYGYLYYVNEKKCMRVYEKDWNNKWWYNWENSN